MNRLNRLIKQRIRKAIFFIFVFFTIILTQSNALGQLDLELIQNLYEQGQFKDVIENLASYQDDNNPLIHEYLASSHEAIGQLDFAIFHWEKAIELYTQKKNVNKAVQLGLVKAQVQIEAGDAQEALFLLPQLPISPQVFALKGNAFLVLGEYEKAIANFHSALELPSSIKLRLSILTNLSQAYEKNTLRLKQQQQLLLPHQVNESPQLNRQIIQSQQLAKTTAQEAWQLAQRFTAPTYPTVRASLAWLPYLSKEKQQQTLADVKVALSNLPPTHQTVILWLNLGDIDGDLEAISEAQKIAIALNDLQGMAIANRKLGEYFEIQHEYSSALEYTQKAIQYAHARLSYEELYRASWQQGRIHEAMGEKRAAELAYDQAVYSLNRIRNKLIAASRDVQFNFQQEVAPVYRNYISLLLENPNNKNLQTVTQIFDLFQLAQLENLFKDTCFDESSRDIEPSAILQKNEVATINTIILPNSFHIILHLPQGTYYHIEYKLTEKQLVQKIQEWQKKLIDINTNKYLKSSQYFYHLLINPFEDILTQSHVKQLLFINDGLLRNLPMSALYDEKNKAFLIQKYPISNSLGKKFLTDFKEKKFPLIAFGLAESRPPINKPLPNVTAELQDIKSIWRANTYLDQEFTKEKLIQTLKEKKPKILHIATHGIFTGDLETTYLQSYDRIINLNQF
ncbi:CHAT domain-containing protein, partial [Crocosphaera sp. Alani8]|uniref:CHAT domain-containing protein n=1 Tax=Crocosphaera sp. Alani8 TaxID=3038952 RepID=UPI00313AC075